MTRPGRKLPRRTDRRTTRRRTAELPDVPVAVAGSGGPAGAEVSHGKTHEAAEPDAADERIRRMIEAAYT